MQRTTIERDWLDEPVSDPITCDACNEPFTAQEWANRHSPGVLHLHEECCESDGCDDE